MWITPSESSRRSFGCAPSQDHQRMAIGQGFEKAFRLLGFGSWPL
jgi:hypothetical protein